MEGAYYKAIALDDKGTKEPVNYVGVHPLVWRDHPDRPEMGFAEIYDVKEIIDSLTDEERYELINSYCGACGSKDTLCQCWNEE
jgi:hypothetical protein